MGNSFPSTDRIRAQKGTEQSPGIQFVDEGDTGLFGPEDGGIALSISGAEVVRFGPIGQIGLAGDNYGTVGQILVSGGDEDAPTWSTISVENLTPGGSDTQLQFNDDGVFAGDGDLTWNKTDNVLGVTGNVNLRAQGNLLFSDSDSSNYVGLKAPTTVSTNLVWTLPSIDGVDGQVLKTDGSGILSWANNLSSASTPGGSDTSVQFNDGGSFGGGSNFTWDKTGNVLGVTGNVNLRAQGNLLFSDSDSSNYVGLKAPATISTNLVWTLPGIDGTNGQVLGTNGTGTLGWITPSVGGGGGGQEYYYSSTAPESPEIGDEWVDSETGKLYTLVDDGNSVQWVEFGAPGFGAQGPAGTITVGTVSTGAAGSSATITNAGTATNAILDFAIPRGDKGDKGDTGPMGPKSATILNPTSPDKIGLLFTTSSQTISRIQSVITGSGSPSVTYTLNYGTDFSATGTAVVTGGITANSTTTGISTTSFNNATVPANNYLFISISSISGTVTSLHVSVTFT